MAEDRLLGGVREFASYLDGLLARLDRGGGWSGVFWRRDPDGMRACLDGREVPPWDVVEALLEDLAGAYGPAAAAAERERARALHRAALAACDARPGARYALADRLGAMLREQRHAAGRRAELTRRLSTPSPTEDAASLRVDLAWARDDHERATARCAELRGRLAALDRRGAVDAGEVRRAAESGPPPGAGGDPETAGERASAGAPWHFRGAGRDVAGEAVGAGVPPYFRDADRDGRLAELRRRGGLAGRGGGSGALRGEGEDPEVAGERASAGPAPRLQDAGRDRPRRPAEPASAPGGAGRPAAGPEPWPARHIADDARRTTAPAAGDPPSPRGGHPQASGAPQGPPLDAAPAKPRKRRRGSARFAGVVEDVAGPAALPQEPLPAGPVPVRSTPRGARFAGAAQAAEPAAAVPGEAVDAEVAAAVAGVVERLGRLRAAGRSGEAHVLLVEVAQWPPERFPALADALHRAGLGADWATLLWEAVVLPAERLVAAADALAAAGREEDGRQMLRQGVARPAEQIGAAVLRLDEAGREREAGVLLDAYVRVRTAEEAARSVTPDPPRLVPLLLRAARSVSDERHWELVYALRVAGHAM